MPLQIVRYRAGNEARWGRLVGAPPLSGANLVEVAPIETMVATTRDLIEQLSGAPPQSGHRIALSAKNLLSPITTSSQLICQGLNYTDHAAEAGHTVRRDNLIFSKASSSLTGPYEGVVVPANVEMLDYEVEVGVVMRRAVTAEVAVTEANLGEFVAGVVLMNDLSARDIMFGAPFLQWFLGKSYRGFCPTGPVLLLLEPEEVAGTLEALQISLSLNGSPRQSGKMSQLIFRPSTTIEQLSAVLDLAAGDVILTGTPGGVIARATPKVAEILATNLFNDGARLSALRAQMLPEAAYLKPGDLLRLELRDSRGDTFLGGQETNIAAPGSN